MAIIVDPDNLDRNQIIFGTEVQVSGAKHQEISIKDVGDVVHATYVASSTGKTASGSFAFTGSGATFQTDLVQEGSVLCLFTGEDAGHWTVGEVISETILGMVSASTPAFTGSGDAHTFTLVSGTGGSSVDGVTEQAVYSFGKEEWRTDTAVFGGDDLIRHPFPFEAITREQMEIGGGTAHDAWDWNTRDNNFTIKKVRTGGWADVNPGSTTQKLYAGIITLGTIDSDAQVYFQQSGTLAAPQDLTFTGPANEAILISSSAPTMPSQDLRSFLKLFVRKKYRTYGQSEIDDIGVSTLEAIVNRFPLVHGLDPAINITEGAIIGTAPFHVQSQNTAVGTPADGDITSGSVGFESLTSTFVTDGVLAGDTLFISGASVDTGYYTIGTVAETSLTCSTDVDFTFFSATESSLSFVVTQTDIVRNIVDDGAIIDVDTATGTITSTAGGFTAAGVATGDMLIITETSSSQGVYKVVSNDSDTVLTVDTSDFAFPAASAVDVDYEVVQPGMYLQFKEETVELVNAGQFTFAAGPAAITRSLGSWSTDGVTAGTVVTVAGATLTANNGSFTVATVENATTLTLVSSDAVVAEGPVTVTSGAFDAFKRVIAGVTYAFRWRLFGNDSTLANHYEFVQNQLRATTDIDFGDGTNNPTTRGDVTDLLMSFASPTAATVDMYIDDLAAADTNNVTYTDATGVARNEAFVAAGAIAFNSNLQNDASAIYSMFFTNDDAGTNLGQDYGSPLAITVKDNDSVDVSGSIGGVPSVSFTYDYDNNVQRGVGSADTDAPVTIVAIGLNTAQFVILQGTIARSKTNNFSLVSTLERNYSNP